MTENYINNNFNLTLATAVNNTNTTLIVSSAVTVDGGFRILIESELLSVTSGGLTTSWTVVRGIEGTTGNAHGATVSINIVLTAQGLSNIISQSVLPTSGVPITSGNTYTGANTGWGSWSTIARIPGSILLAYPASWRVRLLFLGGSPVIGAINVKRTLPYNTSVIDTTAITIGGSASPTLTTPTIVNTDVVNLQLDAAHDYYISMYFTSAGANNTVISGTGGLLTFICGYYSGDATGLTTIPAIAGLGNSFVVCLTQP